jgi:uncharacterized protein YqjF (DUF2071 family)
MLLHSGAVCGPELVNDMSTAVATLSQAGVAPATRAKSARRVFLSARWHLLAMLNWEIDPRLLAPLVPAGTELDFHAGKTYVSVVGFLFRETRLLGLAVPWHRHFEEVNLRFYLQRRVAGEVRRGVAFVKEIVPRWAIAQTARVCYNEPYVALPMRHSVTGPAAGVLGASVATANLAGAGQVEYGWRLAGRWHSLAVSYEGRPEPLAAGSHEEFIAEHYWGYCRQRRGGTVEYQVEHPPWNAWRVTAATLDCEAALLYGSAFAEVLSRPPTTAFLADGSAVAVMQPQFLRAR